MRVKNDMQHANKNDGGSFMEHRDGSHKTESNKILYRAKYERRVTSSKGTNTHTQHSPHTSAQKGI